MTKTVINEDIKEALQSYVDEHPHLELIQAYLYYVEMKFGLEPVLFPRDKIIYQSADDAVKQLEAEGKLWHETEIIISFGNQINEHTKKIYICPFTGKVFGDNTHPNPQDAIYDWVSKCPENKERVGGLPAKRFFISEDPEVIQNYIAKEKHKESLKKKVFSSVINGKLFSTKEAVIKDFKENYLKRLTLDEVQNQDRFQIEEHFLNFIQNQLAEDKIGAFVEALAEEEAFAPRVAKWLE